MTDRELENKISSAFEDMVPEDTFEKISANVVPAKSKERTSITMKKRKNNIVKFVLPMAACLLLAVGIGAGYYYSNNLAVESVIDIDVNPSIEITANKNDKVIDVTALNEDAKTIIGDMNLSKTDLNVAVNAIVGSMVKNGYMENDKNGILVTVLNDDTAKAEALRKEIATDIDSALKENNAEAAVINQTISNTDDVRQFANDNKVSVGKAVFIMNIASKDSTLDPVELSKMSISEIALLVQKKNIDISDIVDYEHDDSLWENIADSIEEGDEEILEFNEAVSSANIIDATDAKLAALAHAKLKTDNVKFVKCELDNDDGRCSYEVEFIYDGYEYEYEINAETGEICGHEKEKHHNESNHH